MTDTNIFEILGRHVAVRGRDATDAVMAEIGAPAKWADVFRPLVEQEVLGRTRARVRDLEDRAFTGGGQGCRVTHESSASPVDAVNDRIALLREAVFIPSLGTYIAWGLLTADQHRERAERQRKLAQDVVVTAERHEASADLLDARGATCLNEIPDVDLAGLVT